MWLNFQGKSKINSQNGNPTNLKSTDTVEVVSASAGLLKVFKIRVQNQRRQENHGYFGRNDASGSIENFYQLKLLTVKEQPERKHHTSSFPKTC